MNICRILPADAAVAARRVENHMEVTAEIDTIATTIAGMASPTKRVRPPARMAIGIAIFPSYCTGRRNATAPISEGIRNLKNAARLAIY